MRVIYGVAILGVATLTGIGLGVVADGLQDEPACLPIPGVWPIVDYDGNTNLWIVDGEVYGYSLQEDSCIVTDVTKLST